MKRLLALLAGLVLLTLSQTCAAQAVQEFTSDSLPTVLASQQGRPFVLVVWSLDCEFCQASLRTLSAIKRKQRQLNVVTLGTDSLSDPALAGMMKKRLGQLGLSKNAWAYGAEPAERLRYAVDKGWHGEMPRSYWFNGRGDSKARSGVITAEMVEAFLAAP
jgi:thiol-disulfide isomerase/thioredoxin